jgi:hypothetical protein
MQHPLSLSRLLEVWVEYYLLRRRKYSAAVNSSEMSRSRGAETLRCDIKGQPFPPRAYYFRTTTTSPSFLPVLDEECIYLGPFVCLNCPFDVDNHHGSL